MSAEFSLILDVQCALGESPVWWKEAGVLVFVDIVGRRLHRFEPRSGRHEIAAVEEDIGCVAPAQGGGYVAGLRSGIRSSIPMHEQSVQDVGVARFR